MTRKAVIFFGTDGTGKTTQANLLVSKLNARGLKAKKAWIRGRHSLAFFISRFMFSLGDTHYFPHPSAVGGKILDTRNIRGKWIWAMIEFVSVIPLIIKRVYIPLMFGYVVVAERYVVDTIVYNEFFIGSSFNPFAKVLLHMIPKGSEIVHLDALKSDVMSRKSTDIFSEKFVDYQLKRYRSFATLLGALSVNSSAQSVDSICNCIFQKFLQV